MSDGVQLTLDEQELVSNGEVLPLDEAFRVIQERCSLVTKITYHPRTVDMDSATNQSIMPHIKIYLRNATKDVCSVSVIGEINIISRGVIDSLVLQLEGMRCDDE
jgi:hypothetical protein